MAWRAIDPAATAWLKFSTLDKDPALDIPLEGSPEFLVGHVPAPAVARIEALRAEAGKTFDAGKLEGTNLYADSGAILRQADASGALWRAIVRYGLRDWRGIENEAGPIAFQSATEKIAGREVTVASEESIQLLEENGLLIAVAVQVDRWQHVLPAERQLFAWASATSTKSLATSAAGATQDSTPTATGPTP